MRYPEYEELLAEIRPRTAAEPENFQQDSLFADPDLEDLLTKSHEQERERIETELDQIESQLQERIEIHGASVAELEGALREQKDRLQRLQRPFVPEDRVASQKRQVRELERQLQEARQVHWRDREQLQREQRRLRRELAELKDTDLSVFCR